MQAHELWPCGVCLVHGTAMHNCMQATLYVNYVHHIGSFDPTYGVCMVNLCMVALMELSGPCNPAWVPAGFHDMIAMSRSIHDMKVHGSIPTLITGSLAPIILTIDLGARYKCFQSYLVLYLLTIIDVVYC